MCGGNVGVQIHHIAPIAKGEVVWTIHPLDVVFIGRLVTTGHYDVRRIVAVAGREGAAALRHEVRRQPRQGLCSHCLGGRNRKMRGSSAADGGLLSGVKAFSGCLSRMRQPENIVIKPI